MATTAGNLARYDRRVRWPDKGAYRFWLERAVCHSAVR